MSSLNEIKRLNDLILNIALKQSEFLNLFDTLDLKKCPQVIIFTRWIYTTALIQKKILEASANIVKNL